MRAIKWACIGLYKGAVKREYPQYRAISILSGSEDPSIGGDLQLKPIGSTYVAFQSMASSQISHDVHNG